MVEVGNSISEALDRFLDRHPNGWNHADWCELTQTLPPASGYETDLIGATLESRRLRRVLRQASVRGLGQKRIEAIVKSFPTLWSLKCAAPQDLAAIPVIPHNLARSILEEVSFASL